MNDKRGWALTRPERMTFVFRWSGWLLPIVAGALLTTVSVSLVHAADPVARDVAISVGLVPPQGPNQQSYGKSPIFDYDGDGDLDVLLSTHLAEWPLMRNRGDGTFASALPGTFFPADRHSCVAADFGSIGGTGRPDGRPDVYCVTGSCKGTCPGPNHLFLQRANGTFAEAGAAWGVADPGPPARDTAALDFNHDGLMDIAVSNTTPSAVPSRDRLFKNVGGRFELVTNTVVNRVTTSVCVEAADLDRDGWTDLVFCGQGSVLVYHNAHGTFQDITPSMPPSIRRNAWDVDLTDLNGDGRPDLLRLQPKRLDVWLNQGGNRFPSTPSFSYPLQQGRGVAAGDVNLDGKADIYVVQASNATVSDVMLINDGNGASYHTMAVPQTRVGSGDAVVTFPNWRGSGRAAFLVTNGDLKNRGPVQLIAFSAR